MSSMVLRMNNFKKFYYEYEVDEGFFIYEDGGGCEHGQYYDICHFVCLDEDDAKNAVQLLNKLWENQKG